MTTKPVNAEDFPEPPRDKLEENYKRGSKFIRDILVSERKHVKENNENKPKPYDVATHQGLRAALILSWASLGAQIGELKRHVLALEARPELKHVGVWKEGKTYREANLVTHAGGLWLASKTTKKRPGQDAAWTLVVKSGSAA